MKRERTTLWRWLLWSLLAGFCMTLASLPALAQYPHTAEILEVAGRWTGTQAEVVWTTGVEYGTGGFRVYRQGTGGEMPLHEGFIPVDITRPAGSYAAVDAERREGEAGAYRIEELRGDGTVVSLGVWTVTFRAAVFEPLIRLAHMPPDALGFELASEPGPAPAAKLPVAGADIYAVSFAALAPVLGLTPGEVAERAHNAMLAMRHGDEAVAYLVDGDAERILFYGWRMPSTYSRISYVFVEPGEGLHIERMAPEAIAVSSDLTFRSPRVYEKDLAIMTERGILRDDLYFWQSFVAGHPTVGVRTFDVPLDGYAGGDVDITVHLLGWNDTPMDPDHQADVLLNGDLLGSVFFDGKDEVSDSFTVPAGTVLPAGNVLTVRAILQSGHTVSYFVLDRFEVTYTRYYEPVTGVLQASDGGHGRLAADRFAAPLVFDVTDRHHPVWIADATGTIPPGHSWVAEAGTEWALRERGAVAIVTPVPGGFGAWLRAPTNAIDYLVVAPRAFETPARAFSDYRASLGLRTTVAIFEDICDQFAAGSRSPESIRSLLAYAHAHWDAAPWMVVLLGWGHYDYLGATTTIPNPLPPLLASDSATLRPADGRLADLTGNGVPDLAIGRIPAQTVAQLEAYLEKLQDYESGEAQAGLQAMLFAADNVDGGGNFTASNIAMGIPAGQRYATAFTTLDSNTVAGVRADIQSALVNGSGIIHYTGHGSFQQLAGENLLHVNDVNAMGKHPPIPLFISLTCLIGRFDMLNTRSLAEALVLKPAGGSLAVYAPSGLSWNIFSQQFGVEFYAQHAVAAISTVGVALQLTRREQLVSGSLHAASLSTYNLLGDPALKLQGGEGSIPAGEIDIPALWRWERFSYAALADPVNTLDRAEALFFERLLLSEEGDAYPAAGGEGAFDIWSADMWDAQSDVSWIWLVGHTSGTYSGQVTYVVMPNPGGARSGSITVSGGGDSRVFSVGQAAAFAPSAGDQVLEWQPQFAWPSVSGATWYQLWINRNGRTYSTPWVHAQTQWVPSNPLPHGAYTWWVRGWSSALGYGAWSQRNDFTMPLRVPGALQLLAPEGAQSGGAIEFRWKNDADATWYRLWVGHPSGGTWHDRWYQIAGGDTGQVSVGGHPGGASTWWLLPWGPHGAGPWSGPVSFSTPDPAPSKPRLIAPLGAVTPPLTLQYESDRAQWYRLYVSRGGSVVMDRWTTSTTFDAGVLSRGTYAWWVGAWNDVTRTVVWSDRGDFGIP